jgi:hypothetical protein
VKIKFLAAFCCLFLIESQLHARVFFVTEAQDTTNATSLRGAIIAADKLGGNNAVVLLHQGTYRLNRYVYDVDEPSGYSGGLVITKGELTIFGQPKAIIDASDLIGSGDLDNSVFHVLTNARVKFENLTIIGGVGYNGGGICNEGTLSLNNCNISGNTSFFYGGGGIYNSGNLSMTKCNISDNSGGFGLSDSDSGGGIYNVGNLFIKNCVIDNNYTKTGFNGDYLWGGGLIIITVGAPIPGFSGGDAGNGGGIYNAGVVSLQDSIISNNICGSGGNGSDSYNDPAGNGGNGGNGGGIYNAGILLMSHCKVENNSSGAGGNGGNSLYYESGLLQDGNGGNAGSGGSGGGIFNAAGASQAQLRKR